MGIHPPPTLVVFCIAWWIVLLGELMGCLILQWRLISDRSSVLERLMASSWSQNKRPTNHLFKEIFRVKMGPVRVLRRQAALEAAWLGD